MDESTDKFLKEKLQYAARNAKGKKVPWLYIAYHALVPYQEAERANPELRPFVMNALACVKAVDFKETPIIAQALTQVYVRTAPDEETRARIKRKALVERVDDLPALVRFANSVKMPDDDRVFFYVCGFGLSNRELNYLYNKRGYRAEDFFWAFRTTQQYDYHEEDPGWTALTTNLEEGYKINAKTSTGTTPHGEDIMRMAAALENNGVDPESQMLEIVRTKTDTQLSTLKMEELVERLEEKRRKRNEEIRITKGMADDIKKHRAAFKEIADEIDKEYSTVE